MRALKHSLLSAFVALSALLQVSAGFPASAQGGTLEYAVKAAYLYKFTPFIDWPASAFAGPASPFNVCTLGGDPFGSSLDRLAGHLVGDHPIRVKRLLATEGAGDCHILYIAENRAHSAEAALSKLRGAPVLTVTDQGLGVTGQIVQFLVKGGHVRFTIDAAAAAANHVAISAKLLSLAAATSGEGGSS